MILAAVLICYLTVALCVARRMVTMCHQDHDWFRNNGTAGDDVMLILGVSVFWALIGLVLGVWTPIKWFVTGGVRKLEGKRAELVNRLTEASSMMNLAKTAQERHIIGELKRSLQEQLEQL